MLVLFERSAREGRKHRTLLAAASLLRCFVAMSSEYRRETVLLFGRNGLLTSRSGLSRMTELAFARLRTIERLREAAPDIPTEQLSTAGN